MLQHKNIVRCHRVYKASTHWVFVLEYLKGGMLLNDLSKVLLLLLFCNELMLPVCGTIRPREFVFCTFK